MKGRRVFRWLRYALHALALLLVIDAGYILGLLPDWEHYQNGPIQKSNFIKTYEFRHASDAGLPSLQWRPVPLSRISRHLTRAIIVAEDARFYEHEGIDAEALKQAMEYNIANLKWAYGGSTISQQMIKNMLLSPSRNPLRKWHELWLTIDLERHVSKRRILEIYMNVAEFGRGIYGAEAGARHYWGKSAASLNPAEAIALAASLSNPVHDNPITRTDYFQRQVRKIRRNLRWSK
ncbi:MAG: monofunctional biosynthetic peptidoglycan transglycosylase [Gammaproteobacteria bacterium]|nr:monofunctional biosynthetic peptidoglycan transglycosylase [Gammaproteobacteria bacterium]